MNRKDETEMTICRPTDYIKSVRINRELIPTWTEDVPAIVES
jgi:hypothetical protein